jgi:hypothetical protein
MINAKLGTLENALTMFCFTASSRWLNVGITKQKESRMNSTVRTMIILLLLTCLLTQVRPIGAYAQDMRKEVQDEFEYFFMESTYLPESNLDNPPDVLEGAKNNVTNFRAALSVPAVMRDGWLLLVNEFSVGMLNFAYMHPPPGREDFLPDNVYTLGYMLRARGHVKKRFWIAAEGGPVLASDMKGIDEDHFNIEGGLVLQKKYRDWTTVGIGLFYTYRLGKPKLLPAVDICYRWRDRFEMNLYFPRRGEMWYRLNDVLDVGVKGELLGNRYVMGSDKVFITGRSIKGTRLCYSVLNVGPAVSVRFAGRFFVCVNVGAELNHRFKIEDENGDEIASLNLEKDFYGRIGLHFEM